MTVLRISGASNNKNKKRANAPSMHKRFQSFCPTIPFQAIVSFHECKISLRLQLGVFISHSVQNVHQFSCPFGCLAQLAHKVMPHAIRACLCLCFFDFQRACPGSLRVHGIMTRTHKRMMRDLSDVDGLPQLGRVGSTKISHS